MRRTIDQWRDMDPETVATGSSGQVFHCIADAQIDILALVSALQKLARLGNGDRLGNSDGNMIARRTLGLCRSVT